MNMHRTFRFLTAACLLLAFLAGCGSRTTRDAASPSASPEGFSPPQIPPMLATPRDRAAYLAAHYWDHFDFRDTSLISRPEIAEQAFADFLVALQQVSRDEADPAMMTLFKAAAADTAMLGHFAALAEKYLYDPNSPYRNEELYIPVLQYLVNASGLSPEEKIRPRYQLEMALKNRPGQPAADFAYQLRNGTTKRMHAIPADYTILFFNNPDCPDCRRVKAYLAASPVIIRLSHAKAAGARVAILALYPDQDIAHWKSVEYPSCMINACDPGEQISKKQLYDLKAIPTLYLLDKNKNVLLKDASPEQITGFLDANCKRLGE